MDLTAIINALIGSGPWGIGVALLAFWCYRLNNKLSEVEAARVADAEAYTERALLLSDKLHTSIDKVYTIAETLTASQKK